MRDILESFENVPTVAEEEFFLEKTAAILEDIVEDAIWVGVIAVDAGMMMIELRSL